MENSHHTRGEMAIDGHQKTYSGFMSASIWGAGLIIVICLMAILIFAVHLAWPAALLITFAVGVIYGLVLKMKMSWFAGLVGLAVFGAVVSFIITLAAS